MKVDVQSNRKFIKLKYKLAWYAGIVLSFLLYFSGIIGLYIFLRKKYFKKYFAVVLTYHRVNDNNNSPDITVSQKILIVKSHILSETLILFLLIKYWMNAGIALS